MHRLLLLLLVFGLWACEDADKLSDREALAKSIQPLYPDRNTEPELAQFHSSNVEIYPVELSLNTHYLHEGAPQQLSFIMASMSPLQDDLVSLVLENHTFNTSLVAGVPENEPYFTFADVGFTGKLVFPVYAGGSYFFNAMSYIDGDFDLKVVSANRESLKLSENEYYASWDMVDVSDCGDVASDVEVHHRDAVINFKDGYYIFTNGYSLDDFGRDYFDRVDGRFIYIKDSFESSYSFEGSDFESTSVVDMVLDINGAKGSFTGERRTVSSTVNLTDQGAVEICTYEDKITGTILL